MEHADQSSSRRIRSSAEKASAKNQRESQGTLMTRISGKPTFKDRFLYYTDSIFARGPAGLIWWLVFFSLCFVSIIALVVWHCNINPECRDFPTILWMAILRALDPGVISNDSGSRSFLAAMFFVTVGGVVIVSTLISIISNTITERFNILRKGRSRVVETNHTVILGWTQEIFTIISELVLVNANHTHPCIIILADRDKVAMEDEIRERIPHRGRTRIICRTGSPLEFHDLHLTNLNEARSIIVLSPDEKNPDSEVIKTLLAILNNPERRHEPYHIVAVIHKPENIEIARMVAGNEAVLLLEDDVISRIIAQTCYQTGLSIIYQEILDYTDDDLYFTVQPSLYGKTFGEALSAFEHSCLIGIMKQGEKPCLNPPHDTLYNEGDQLLCLTVNDVHIHTRKAKEIQIDEAVIKTSGHQAQQSQKTLILGWNTRSPLVIQHLDSYMVTGSKVTVLVENENLKEEYQEDFSGLKHLTVDFVQGDMTNRKILDKMDVSSYNHTIVMSDLALEAQ